MLGSTPRTRLTRAAATLAALSLLAGASVATAQSPSAAPMAPMGSMTPAATITVDGAWARVSPMMSMAGAAYLTIHNSGTTDDALIGATSPIAGSVETHETKDDGTGQMAMSPVDSIPVPAGGSVELKPGGYHIMLIDLTQPLDPGVVVPLTLTFQSGAVVEVQAVVGEGPASSGAPMPMGSMAPTGAMPSASPAM
ncbi:MAG: copper chaperone PCu(A)C [Chloroflexota bacterium]